ncbi:hypothetical protein MWN34_11160 [Ancylobacter sp. 6x-1]|uniref:DUF2066 domain-containing protein n=1 Tax=Ancylobacter crimeensis TaxID=2579147 RepID=A0ABT0DBZ1_9HYPH|nr:hypothetical protein [Ancylobacter crimeensis]MCK0197473.1 hypothetical protein [Ancylobacter crimeensis]
MRHYWIGLFVAAFAFLAQTGISRADGPVFPGDGNTGLVPPAGMVEVTDGPTGVENRAAKSAILVADIPLPAFDEVKENFSDEMLAKQGITIAQHVDVDLPNGAKGWLLKGSQNVGPVTLRKWLMLVRGEKGAALVTAQFPQLAADIYPDSVVETALRSVVFRDPPSDLERLSRLPFTLSLPDGYRVVKVFGAKTVLATKGPSDDVGASSQPYFIVSIAQGDIREEDRESLSKRSIAGVPGVKDLHVDRGGPLRINGSPGVEMVASAVNIRNEAPMKVAQWISFGRTSFIRMVGVAPADGFDASFAELRQARDGVQLR